MRVQSAFEFLTTYGWAILLLAVVLGILYGTGLFNPGTFTNTQCFIGAGITCQSAYVSENGMLSLQLLQGTNGPISITAVGCTQNGSITDMQTINQVYLPAGKVYTFEVQCYSSSGNKPVSGAVGTVFSGTIIINYTDEQTGIPKTITGKITSKLGSSIATSASTTAATTTAVTTTPTVTLTFSNGNSINPGTSDTVTGTTSISTDTVGVYYSTSGYPYCYVGGDSGTLLGSTSTGTTSNSISGAPSGTYYVEACDTTAGVSAVNTLTIATPTVTLTFSNGNSINPGTSDTVTGTTSISTDTVGVYYSAGYPSCYVGGDSGTLLGSTGTGTASGNANTLASGTYYVEACDTTAGVSAVNTLTVTAPTVTVTLTLSSNSINPGTSDPVTGTTSISTDTVGVYYSTNGNPSCSVGSDSGTLLGSTGTGTASGNANTLTSGTYYIEACDTTEGVASAVNTMTVTAPTVTLTLSSNSINPGTSDPVTGTTSISTDTVGVYYGSYPFCYVGGDYGALLGSTGTGTASGNADTLASGTYYVEACDTTAGVASAENTLTIATPTVTLTFSNGNSINPGTSDTVTGTTSFSIDTVGVYYSTSGYPSCYVGGDSGTLLGSTGTGTTSNSISGAPSGTYYVEACDTTAGVSAVNTLTIATPTVTLTFSNGDSINPGTSDTITGTTSISTDTVGIYYAPGGYSYPSCYVGSDSGTLFGSTGTGTASGNADTLASGTYYVEACDTTAGVASAENTLTIATPTVTIALSSNSINQGTSDTITGTTSFSTDTVGVYYAVGDWPGCAVGSVPYGTLLGSTGTGTASGNADTLAAGTYYLITCDTTAGVASTTSAGDILTVN